MEGLVAPGVAARSHYDDCFDFGFIELRAIYGVETGSPMRLARAPNLIQ